ncbi:MAG: 2-amino-4-hydroxy-6-hydroxymethyldihydropteridine diphosphokinase [Propionibacteriaceae bacterium]|jgi:2-amino-4-hydroxy-6-hydroxymethyldihydropteridine diphosphokinase|nr:2-amino-4-hydroxy-6-hydroxymethyldihydropteridine diphosphokinase [Propionibacteriaceae bacterium]
MSASEVVLSLGSNMGNSVALLRRAITLLDAHSAIRVDAVSSVYVTAPQGYANQRDFLNVVIVVVTTLKPYALLRLTRYFENKLGRVRSIQNGPRTIDIDIISFEKSSLVSSELILPHPRASQRRFVLAPWLELRPAARLEGQPTRKWHKRTLAQACERTWLVVN